MYNNVSLLPHDESIRVKGIDEKLRYLKLMKYFVEEIYLSIYHFKSDQLYRFDAHVGETLCQIRAYKILLLKHHKQDLQEKKLFVFEESLKNTYCDLKRIIAEYSNPINSLSKQRRKKVRKEESISDFFSSEGIYLEIDSDILFIFLSCFLSFFKVAGEDRNSILVDYEKISGHMEISRFYSKKIVKNFQRIISRLSSDFIASLSDELSGREDLKQMLPLLRKETNNGRSVFPCYFVTDIILSHMIQNGMNLLFIVSSKIEKERKIKFLPFKGDKLKDNFSCVDSPDAIKRFNKEGCLVITGVCDENKANLNDKKYLNKLLKLDIRKIILMNTATHPQFSGESLAHLSEQPLIELIKQKNGLYSLPTISLAKRLARELNTMKSLASKKGCSLDNKATFFAKHIFCDIFNSYIFRDNFVSVLDDVNQAYFKHYSARTEVDTKSMLF